MQIVTYYSSNAKSFEAWLAYIVLPTGEQWLVRFHGKTEQEAIDKAKFRWESEQKRYQSEPIEDSLPDHAGAYGTEAMVKVDGRGAHLRAMVGKLWVINRATQHLCRIDPSELQDYEGQGYVRGGPRSK